MDILLVANLLVIRGVTGYSEPELKMERFCFPDFVDLSKDSYIIPFNEEQDKKGAPDLSKLRRGIPSPSSFTWINIFMGQKIKGTMMIIVQASSKRSRNDLG